MLTMRLSVAAYSSSAPLGLRSKPAPGAELRRNTGHQKQYADRQRSGNPTAFNTALQHKQVQNPKDQHQNRGLRKKRRASPRCNRKQLVLRGIPPQSCAPPQRLASRYQPQTAPCLISFGRPRPCRKVTPYTLSNLIVKHKSYLVFFTNLPSECVSCRVKIR